jgi:hypothetical protein
VHHCDCPVPVMTDLGARAMEYAAACEAASRRANNSMDRLTFHMLRELWRTLTKHDNVTGIQVTTEFNNLLEIQQDVVRHVRSTLH